MSESAMPPQPTVEPPAAQPDQASGDALPPIVESTDSASESAILTSCYKKLVDEYTAPVSPAEARAVERAIVDLRNWQERLSVAQAGHYFLTVFFSRLNIGLGIVTVLVSSAVTIFAVGDLSNGNTRIVVILSLVSTALTGLQTMFRLSEKSEEHRTRAARYGALKRKIEAFLIRPVRMRHIRTFVDLVTVEWDAIADDSPVTPQWVTDRIRRGKSKGQTQAAPVAK